MIFDIKCIPFKDTLLKLPKSILWTKKYLWKCNTCVYIPLSLSQNNVCVYLKGHEKQFLLESEKILIKSQVFEKEVINQVMTFGDCPFFVFFMPFIFFFLPVISTLNDSILFIFCLLLFYKSTIKEKLIV